MDISVYLKQQLSAPTNLFDLNVNTSFTWLCAGTDPQGKSAGGRRRAEGHRQPQRPSQGAVEAHGAGAAMSGDIVDSADICTLPRGPVD